MTPTYPCSLIRMLVTSLERELSRVEAEKKTAESQLREGQACLLRQVSQMVGREMGGANSLYHTDSLQHIARYMYTEHYIVVV